MIYVFGNSHAHFFTNSKPQTSGYGERTNEYFKSYSLGPVIAYNFTPHHLPRVFSVLEKSEFDKSKDSIILAVGEVDCRWHLPKKSSDSNLKIKDVVDECVNRFFESYILLKSSGYNVIGWGVQPSTNEEHNDETDKPIFGSVHFRNEVSNEWNGALQVRCVMNGFKYTDIFVPLLNTDLTTKSELYYDYCHLNSEILLEPVIEKFKKEGLI